MSSLPLPPGLQRERTLFAWRRTLVSLSLTTVLVAFCAARVAPSPATAAVVVTGVATAAVALAMLLAERHDPRRTTEPWHRLRLAVTVVVALAVAGAVCAAVEAAVG